MDALATPAAAVVGSDAPAARADTVKLKDLIESVASATGGKKAEVKATVEADDQKLVIVYRLEPDRQMTWSSYVEGGQALITDGVSISGRQSAWYNRCPNGLPAA